MATLLLRLAAPMQSWGIDSKFDTRKTNREPTKSGVIGLLAAALGLRRDADQALERLNQLRFAVRVDQEGSLLVDFHTAKSEKTNYVTKRYYLADAIFLVGLESEDRPFLEQLDRALRSPAYPLFLGRRSCPPTQPICLGIRETGLKEALLEQELLVPKWRSRRAGKCRIVEDALPKERGVVPRKDLAVSFNPVQRQFAYRAVREFSAEVSTALEETTHDPFLEL